MNQYESPDGISWRYNTLIWAARTCLAVPGDFVECGVYRGDMTWMVTRNVGVRESGKAFYLYDTFSGFDPRYSSEADFSYAPQAYEATNRDYRAPGIEDHVRHRFRHDDYVVVTKGAVPDILHKIAPQQIAFLHLDMNSPRAEVGALEVLFERVSPNGIIVFDDYGWKLFQPQKVAADEFMAARGQSIMEMPTGQGLLIKRC
jgi:O-methyltransferase